MIFLEEVSEDAAMHIALWLADSGRTEFKLDFFKFASANERLVSSLKEKFCFTDVGGFSLLLLRIWAWKHSFICQKRSQ